MDDKVFYDIINCVDSAAMSLVWPAVQLIIGFFGTCSLSFVALA